MGLFWKKSEDSILINMYYNSMLHLDRKYNKFLKLFEERDK